MCIHEICRYTAGKTERLLFAGVYFFIDGPRRYFTINYEQYYVITSKKQRVHAIRRRGMTRRRYEANLEKIYRNGYYILSGRKKTTYYNIIFIYCTYIYSAAIQCMAAKCQYHGAVYIIIIINELV